MHCCTIVHTAVTQHVRIIQHFARSNDTQLTSGCRELIGTYTFQLQNSSIQSFSSKISITIQIAFQMHLSFANRWHITICITKFLARAVVDLVKTFITSSLNTTQNLAAVCHTISAYVRSPKYLRALAPTSFG